MILLQTSKYLGIPLSIFLYLLSSKIMLFFFSTSEFHKLEIVIEYRRVSSKMMPLRCLHEQKKLSFLVKDNTNLWKFSPLLDKWQIFAHTAPITATDVMSQITYLIKLRPLLINGRLMFGPWLGTNPWKVLSVLLEF